MTRLEAFHLPGFDPTNAPRRGLGRTPFEIPEPDRAAIESIWQRLESAAAAWRQRSPDERAACVAELAAAFLARGPGEKWEEGLVRSTGLSPAGLAAAWRTTFEAHDLPSLKSALVAESQLFEMNPRPAARIVHVLAGNVLPATFTLLVRGFLVGAPQWLRPASREPLFAACIAARARELHPDLADTCAVLWWTHGSALEASVLESAGVVTVQGGDATIATLRKRVHALAPDARFVGYGSRWSCGLLSRAAQTPENAQRLAWDLALFDQQGCLSPSIIFAEQGPGLGPWCATLAAALAALERRIPRGEVTDIGRSSLRAWRERQRLAVALGEARALWESDASSAWGVVLGERGRWEDSPLDRHVPVVPFESTGELVDAIGARRPSLQGVAADLATWSPAHVRQLLASLRPTRVAAPGQLQQAPAGWPQDHHPPLASLHRNA